MHSPDHRRVGIAQIYEVSPPVIHHVVVPSCQRPPQHLTSQLRYECLDIVPLLSAQGLAPEDRSGELAVWVMGKEWKMPKGKKFDSILPLVINYMQFSRISRVVAWSPQDHVLALQIRNKLFSFFRHVIATYFFHPFTSFLLPIISTSSFLSLIYLSPAATFQFLFPLSLLPSSLLLHTIFSHIPSLIALPQQCPETGKVICFYKKTTAAASACLMKVWSLWQEQLLSPWSRGNISY